MPVLGVSHKMLRTGLIMATSTAKYMLAALKWEIFITNRCLFENWSLYCEVRTVSMDQFI